jgi:hypothetical protein
VQCSTNGGIEIRPSPSVAFIHFMNFANEIGHPRPGESTQSGGLFAMLGLDPLAGLDPAVKQIEQTRQLAERTIYYMQRVPYIMNLQFAQLSSEMLARPETRTLLEDTDRVSESVERFSQVVAALPATISAEREALVNQLSTEMLSQQQALRPLLVDLRATLEAGSATADSVDALIHSLDSLIARFPQEHAGTQSSAASKPFDISEYTAAAAELTRTATELRQLITTLDADAPLVASSIDGAIERTQSLIDHLFARVAILIVLIVIAVLAAALIYRAIDRRSAQPR